VKIVWTRRALTDLARITDRIAQDKPLVAQAFVEDLREKVARLQTFPLLGRASPYDDARELVVHRNYLVTYRIRADEVQVLQVWHVARQR